MSEAGAVRKNIIFPVDLIKKINSYARSRNVDFSKFIREAAEEYVKTLEKEQMQKKLEEGYKAKAKLNLKISGDFKHSDGENI